MTAPIILPPLKAAGFDLVWFGVVMTITMEMGLNLGERDVRRDVLDDEDVEPDRGMDQAHLHGDRHHDLMAVAVVILCLVPGIALWLPDLLLPTLK
jgi:C4-dicarboxylate transporter DctM subunit